MPTKQTTKKTLKDLQPIIQVQQDKLEEEAKAILKQEAKELFDYFPHIEAIRWQQRRRLDCSDFAPVEKSEFHLDGFEYHVKRSAGMRAVAVGDPALRDCGFNMSDDDWISPWNDSRVAQAELLDQFADFETKLFDAEGELSTAIGSYDRVTVTRKNVLFEQF